jgi:hypothetical protein
MQVLVNYLTLWVSRLSRVFLTVVWGCRRLGRGSGSGFTKERKHMLQYWAPSWFSYPQDGHFIIILLNIRG